MGDIMLNGLAQPMMMNNSWTVPYSPVLKAFKCHINVELCQTIQAIKYLFKYIHKGSDMAIISLQNTDQPPDPHQYDEIKKYEMSKYICTGEAIWRILKFNINECYPSVEKLVVYLENGQRIYFNDTEQAH